jgi:hypothetical protein
MRSRLIVSIASRKPTVASLRRKFVTLRGSLSEKQRRHWAAVEAREIGRGGISWVNEATGLSRTTIHAGVKEVGKKQRGGERGSRKPGGGRKALTTVDPVRQAKPGEGGSDVALQSRNLL